MIKRMDRKGRIAVAFQEWDGKPESLIEDTLDNLLIVAFLSGMGDVMLTRPTDERIDQIVGIADARDMPTSL